MTVSAFNPMRCRVWKLHSRLEDYITEETCRAEIISFETHGQVVPALGRRLRGEDYEVEIICGARRLFAARYLNKPLLVELREFSDREAIAAMEMENRMRQDISAYERAISYESWLTHGQFESRQALCKALGISPARLCRLLRLATLPKCIVDAFRRPDEIRESWGIDLAEMLKDPVTLDALVVEASKLNQLNPRLPGHETYRRLRSVHRATKTGHGRVVRDRSGKELFRVRRDSADVIFQLPLHALARRSLQEIETLMMRALREEPCTTDPSDPRSPAQTH